VPITAAGRSRHETITLSHGDEEAEVVIDPSFMTIAKQIELQSLRDPAEQTQFLIEILCGLVVDWEIEGEDGKLLPITEDSMLGLENRLVWAIYTGIREAREDEGKGSGRTSSRRGSTGRAPGGTR
jgi:hypothetical protein